jgi:hypothetical protein
MAFRGHIFDIGIAGTQANLRIKNNTFRNFWMAGINTGPNGAFGIPTNLYVIENKFISDLHTVYPGGEAVFAGDLWGGSPGTSAVVKDNHIDLAYTGPGDTGGTWNLSGIDLEIMGQAVVSENRIKMNSGVASHSGGLPKTRWRGTTGSWVRGIMPSLPSSTATATSL